MASQKTEEEAPPVTLPAWLRRQARLRPEAVALRYKRGGIWHERTWGELDAEVDALSRALHRRGVRPGEAFLVVSEPRFEAVVVTLAVHRLGAHVVAIDPGADLAPALRSLDIPAVRFGFVEREAQRVALRDEAFGLSDSAYVIQADARGFIPGADAAVEVYEAAVAQGAALAFDLPDAVAASFVAFTFAPPFGEVADDLPLAPETLTHEELVATAQALATAEKLNDEHEALVSRAFATTAHARYVLGPWLLAGFCLNFPENVGTRDNDRRELGPTLVIGTRETYERLYRLVQSNLPGEGTWQRSFVQWGLNAGGGLLQATIGEWVIRRPLRDVLGFTRLQVPLLVGAPLEPETTSFFARLDIVLRAWPDPRTTRASQIAASRLTTSQTNDLDGAPSSGALATLGQAS